MCHMHAIALPVGTAWPAIAPCYTQAHGSIIKCALSQQLANRFHDFKETAAPAFTHLEAQPVVPQLD